MKRISHADEELITSNEIADRLVDYAVQVCRLNTSSAVTIPVLESSGIVASHTLVINAASQFDVVEVDWRGDGAEVDRFGDPEFPPIGARASMLPLEHADVVGFDEFGDLI
jgi:hypothetical protein